MLLEGERNRESGRQTDRRRVEHSVGNNFGCTSYFAAFTFTCSLQDKKQTGRLSSAIRLSAFKSHNNCKISKDYNYSTHIHERGRGGGE